MDDFSYYYCYRDCNLCDGYGYLGNAPEGCLVAKEAISPGVYCCIDSGGYAVCYVQAENPEDALQKSVKKIKKEGIPVKGDIGNVRVNRIVV
jgi:hypothetical protein